MTPHFFYDLYERMGTTTLPPQAYTRDILAKAFIWLQGQPESICKLASSPDALVGLFLRAQRTGGASFETVAPVSRDNFMNDLKSLASELEQFDVPKHPPQMQFHEPPAPSYSAPNMVVQNFQLDAKSKEMIEDVKDQLNLSSETEVLRLLVVLGYEKAKSIFPAKS